MYLSKKFEMYLSEVAWQQLSHDIGAGCFYSSGRSCAHLQVRKSETKKVRTIFNDNDSESKSKDGHTFAGWRGEDRALCHLSSVPHYPYTSDYGPGLPGRDWAAGRRTPNLRQPSLGSTHHRQAAQRPSFGDFLGIFWWSNIGISCFSETYLFPPPTPSSLWRLPLAILTVHFLHFYRQVSSL